jgi:hypothetical protein
MVFYHLLLEVSMTNPQANHEKVASYYKFHRKSDPENESNSSALAAQDQTWISRKKARHHQAGLPGGWPHFEVPAAGRESLTGRPEGA